MVLIITVFRESIFIFPIHVDTFYQNETVILHCMHGSSWQMTDHVKLFKGVLSDK